MVNDSLSAGIPAWRYLYNASFADIQPLPGLGVFHGSEGVSFPSLRGSQLTTPVPLIFGTLPDLPTAFEVKLSKYMQKVWADFAKNPQAGPPWPRYPEVAVLGTIDKTVAVVPAAELDARCAFLDPFLELAPSGS